ncbi:hypothetical protein OJAV_G00133360 [Oryzias javanicus]|uniref:Uncharacterized protein n=1 Tax=Oryzias javanicus TaxID=123683 RepID=A0A437CSG8_ORYJA|nr:hypothetical protein OJAV_G00133360 [Oryzias javanicus]
MTSSPTLTEAQEEKEIHVSLFRVGTLNREVHSGRWIRSGRSSKKLLQLKQLMGVCDPNPSKAGAAELSSRI